MQDYLFVIIGIIVFIPGVILIRYYQRTKIIDYLLFAGVFFLSGINQFTAILVNNFPDNVLFVQITNSAFVLSYLFFFLHLVKVKWEHPPRILWYLGITWYAIMQFLIFFYERVDIPGTGVVLFLQLRKVERFDTPTGIGLITQGGIIILSQGYLLLPMLYRIALHIFGMYVYATAKPVLPEKRLRIAKRLFVLAFATGSIHTISYLGHLFSLWNNIGIVQSLSNLTMLSFFAVVSIFYSEAVLISHVQVSRATELHKTIQNLDNPEKIQKFGMPSLVEYLNNIPPELLAEISEGS